MSKSKIFVICEGGIVQGVATVGLAAGAEVVVIDHDIDDEDEIEDYEERKAELKDYEDAGEVVWQY